jgi:hypothetical protein
LLRFGVALYTKTLFLLAMLASKMNNNVCLRTKEPIFYYQIINFALDPAREKRAGMSATPKMRGEFAARAMKHSL